MLLAALLGAAAGAGAACLWRRGRERIRARYLSFVAHEISAPITSMNMTVLNFLQGTFGRVAEGHRPWLALLGEEAARLRALVNDLRDLIHLEFHRDLRLKPGRVEVPDAVREVLELMGYSLERRGIPVETRFPAGLPAVYSDPDRLGRIFCSLLLHAKKFRARGPIVFGADDPGPGPTVRVWMTYEGLEVPPEQVRRALDLYAPVAQEDSQVLTGVGLGLGFPRRILEAQGGGMSAEAAGGTWRVTLELPKAGAGGGEA